MKQKLVVVSAMEIVFFRMCILVISVNSLNCVHQLAVASARRPHKSTQTEQTFAPSEPFVTDTTTDTCLDDSTLPECTCDAKQTFDSMKEKLEHDYQIEKLKALKALEERVGLLHCCN